MIWTCIECGHNYDDTDGDTDERMCNKCLNLISNNTKHKEKENEDK